MIYIFVQIESDKWMNLIGGLAKNIGPFGRRAGPIQVDDAFFFIDQEIADHDVEWGCFENSGGGVHPKVWENRR